MAGKANGRETAETLRSLKASARADAERRLGALRAPRKQYLERHWPGEPELRFKMAVLSCSDIASARAAAFAYLKVDLGLEPDSTLNLDLYQDEVVTQILFRACRDPENPSEPFASDAADLRDSSTADERTALWDEYNDWRSSIDPAPDEIPPEVLAEMEDAVKKKDRGALLAFGGRRLSGLLLSLADRLYPSSTPKSDTPSGSTPEA